MTGSIQKDDFLTLAVDLIGADALGNAASLLAGDRAGTDAVQEGCFTVVYMTHYGDDRRAQNQRLG